MGQIVIPECGCCLCDCCSPFPQLPNGYPCQLYYFTDGDPFTMVNSNALDLRALNCDINLPFGSFFSHGSQNRVLAMAGQTFFSQGASAWSGGFSNQVFFTLAYDAPSNSMVLTILIDAAAGNTLVLKETLTYTLPLAQFNPCADNTFTLTSDVTTFSAGHQFELATKAQSVIISPLSHGHKGLMLGAHGGIIIDSGPLPDFPCACALWGCTMGMPVITPINNGPAFTAQCPALFNAGWVRQAGDPKIPMFQAGDFTQQANPLCGLYVGAVGNLAEGLGNPQVIDNWYLVMAVTPGAGCAAYSMSLVHDKFQAFTNGNNHPVLCKLTSMPSSCNCHPAPSWVFNNFALAGPSTDCSPFADFSKISVTVTL